MRKYERNSPADTEHRRMGRKYPDAGAEIFLHSMKRTMVSPPAAHGAPWGRRDPPVACGEHQVTADGCLKEAVNPVGSPQTSRLLEDVAGFFALGMWSNNSNNALFCKLSVVG